MFILPIKSRLQIVEGRKKSESIWTGKNIIMFITPTPEKNAITSSKYRAEEFVRLLPILSKKIHKKAVVRNKFRRRIKEAFRLIDKNLLKNKYDYQILAKQSIFKATVSNLIEDIENCLKGNAIKGIPEKNNTGKKKKKNKHNRIKTSEALNLK